MLLHGYLNRLYMPYPHIMQLHNLYGFLIDGIQSLLITACVLTFIVSQPEQSYHLSYLVFVALSWSLLPYYHSYQLIQAIIASLRLITLSQLSYYYVMYRPLALMTLLNRSYDFYTTEFSFLLPLICQNLVFLLPFLNIKHGSLSPIRMLEFCILITFSCFGSIILLIYPQIYIALLLFVILLYVSSIFTKKEPSNFLLKFSLSFDYQVVGLQLSHVFTIDDRLIISCASSLSLSIII